MRSQILLGAILFTAAVALGDGRQLSGQHAPAKTPALSPVDAQKAFVVPEGFDVRLFAAEPDVINPVAMTWDDRGRLWVLELYEYPLGAPPGTKGRDRIKILEDTTGSGRADKITVFADGLNLATGLALGNGGVYVAQAPDLLFLQDTNHDDHADTRTTVLTGFGLNDRHELLNGLTWGPDGWLYMTHGVFNHSVVRNAGTSESGIEMSAALARFDPRSKTFEVYADGTSNPWGVDFDVAGNAFVSACVIDHLFHMAAGGIYQRQGGTPENPHAYEFLPSIVNHTHYMAAYSGICIYQGNLFPEEYRGTVFMGNIHQNAINHDRLTPNGSSFIASAEPDFLTTTDGWFMPVSEQTGPDGALWIADWYDKYPCYQNAQADPEGVDRERGRIWRVVYTGKNKGANVPCRPDAKMNLAKLSNPRLADLLEHPNIWQRRAAQRILDERSEKWATPDGKLEKHLEKLIFDSTSLESRMAALWTLDRSFHISAATVQCLATNQEPVLRAQAARLIGENNLTTQNGLGWLEDLASDSDPRVRLSAATAVRQLVSGSLTIDTPPREDNVRVGSILAALIHTSADAKDPLLPFMIWMAGEGALAEHPGGGLRWLAENGAATMPLSGILAGKAMRRICDTGDAAKVGEALKFIDAVAQTSSGLAIAALDGLIEGQKAKAVVPAADVGGFIEKINATGNAQIQERARQLGALWGDASSVAATLRIAGEDGADVQERIKAVRAAARMQNDAAREAMLDLISRKNPEALRIDALRAAGSIGGDKTGAAILQQWKNLSPAERQAAADVLVSRWNWAGEFLNAVEDKIIQPSEISASVFRAISNYHDPIFDSRAERLLGRFRESTADKLKIIAAKRKMIMEGEPDIARGHEIARRTCFVCHKMHGEGADVGPDLTGVGRSTLDMLLANVIDPNQVVGKGYENVEVETKDGRSVSGRMVENSDTRIKLLSAGPKEDVIAKSDVASIRVSALSVMPEGLEQMPDKDFRDLIWYIMNPPEDNRPMTPELREQLTAH